MFPLKWKKKLGAKNPIFQICSNTPILEKSPHFSYPPCILIIEPLYQTTFGWMNILPSGKLIQKTIERSTMLLMGNSTISMAMFNSFLYVYQRVTSSLRCFVGSPPFCRTRIASVFCVMHLAPPSLHVLEISQTWSNMIKHPSRSSLPLACYYCDLLWYIVILTAVGAQIPRTFRGVRHWLFFAAMLHCKARPHQDADRITGSLQPSIPKPVGCPPSNQES